MIKNIEKAEYFGAISDCAILTRGVEPYLIMFAVPEASTIDRTNPNWDLIPSELANEASMNSKSRAVVISGVRNKRPF